MHPEMSSTLPVFDGKCSWILEFIENFVSADLRMIGHLEKMMVLQTKKLSRNALKQGINFVK